MVVICLFFVQTLVEDQTDFFPPHFVTIKCSAAFVAKLNFNDTVSVYVECDGAELSCEM